MSADQIVAAFLCIWYGFAVAHQIHAQSTQDKILTNELGHSGWWRLFLVRFIFFVTGMLGFIGFVSVVGSMPAFKGPVFPVGLFIGIALFVLTNFLNKARP
jgi:hypothetical protein